MRNIELYNFIPNGNLHYYPLNRTPTENNYIVQIGEVSQSLHLENKRFTAANGTPVLYIGYSEETTTLTLEGTVTALSILSSAIKSNCEFVLSNILTRNGISACRLLITGDLTYTLVSRKMDLMKVSVPVQILSENISLPYITFLRKSVYGFSFANDVDVSLRYAVLLSDCDEISPGVYKCRKSVELLNSGETTEESLFIDAAYGGKDFGNEIVMQFACKVSGEETYGTAVTVTSEETGCSVALPDVPLVDARVSANANGAKPITVYFQIKRLRYGYAEVQE